MAKAKKTVAVPDGEKRRSDLTVKLAELSPIIQRLASTSDDRSLPVFQYLHFDGKTIRSYDGKVGTVYNGDWDFGQMTMPAAKIAKHLADLVLRNHTEVTFRKTDKQVVLSDGNVTTRCTLLPADQAQGDFLGYTPPKKMFPVSKTFWAQVAQVEAAMSKDASPTAAMFRGVYWGPEGDFVACSRDRIAYTKPGPDKCPFDGGLLIPATLLERFKNRDEFTRVAEATPGVWFGTETGSYLHVNLIQEPFPYAVAQNWMKGAREQAKTEPWVILPAAGNAISNIVNGHLVWTNTSVANAVDVAVDPSGLIKFLVQEPASPSGPGSVSEDSVKGETKGLTEPVTARCNGEYLRDALAIANKFSVAKGKHLYFANDLTEVMFTLIAG